MSASFPVATRHHHYAAQWSSPGRSLGNLCHGPVYRVPRRFVDLCVSLFMPVHRYRCGGLLLGGESACEAASPAEPGPRRAGQRGNRRPRAGANDPRPTFGTAAVMNPWGTPAVPRPISGKHTAIHQEMNMASVRYHEPVEELSAATRDMHTRVRQLIA